MKEQLTNELLTFEADHAWVSENLETLLEQYTDQWIGVKNGQVIANDPVLAGLLSKLAEPSHICVEFIIRDQTNTEEATKPRISYECGGGNHYAEGTISNK